MESKDKYLMLFLFFLLIGFASSSSYVSYDALEHHGSTGRSLLQAKQACTVNFEAQNYTIITSKCKGPNYNATVCCDAFLEFACPFSDQINDMGTDCATTMFSYINLYGKYPPGLFSNMCRGDKNGLLCGEEENHKDGAMKNTQSTLLVIIASLLLLLFNNVF